MRNKYLLAAISALVFLPKIAFADVIVPVSMLTLPLIPGIVLVEFIVFLVARKMLKFNAKLYMLLLAVFAANLATSILGTIFPLYKSLAQNMMSVAGAFVLSVLVEWGIYELFFRKKIDKTALFLVSLGGNTLTYAFIVGFVIF